MFRVRFPDGLPFRARIGSLEGPPVDPEVGRTDIRWFLGGAAVDQGRSNGRPWSSSMSTKRTTAKVSEADQMGDILGKFFQTYGRQLAFL